MLSEVLTRVSTPLSPERLLAHGAAILSLICIRCDIIRTPDSCLRPLRSGEALTAPICASEGINFPYAYSFITMRMLIMSLMNV